MDFAGILSNFQTTTAAAAAAAPTSQQYKDLLRSTCLKKLDLLATEIGLQYHADGALVTICGQVFLVDIEVDALGEIVKVKLSYASESDLAQSDEVSE